MVFSPDNKHIISGDFDGMLFFWSKNKNKPKHEHRAHNNRINNISFSEDGRFMATASSDKTAKVWTYPDMKLVKTYNSDHNISFILFHPDSRQVYFGGQDGSIYKHSFLSKSNPYPIYHNPYFITSATYSPDEKHLVFSSGFSIKFLNLSTSRVEKEIGSCSDYVNQIVFTPKGNLISWCEDGTLNYWDYRFGFYGLLYSKKAGKTGYSNLVASNDNKYLLTGNSDNNARIWDLQTKSLVGELKGHMDVVRSFAFSKGNHYIATCSYDGNIILWGTPYRYQQEQKKIMAQKAAADELVRSELADVNPMINKAGNNKTVNPISELDNILNKSNVESLKEIKKEAIRKPKAPIKKEIKIKSQELAQLEVADITSDISQLKEPKAKVNKLELKPEQKPHFSMDVQKIPPLKQMKDPLANHQPKLNKETYKHKSLNFEAIEKRAMEDEFEAYSVSSARLEAHEGEDVNSIMKNIIVAYEQKNVPSAIDNRKVITSKTVAVSQSNIEVFIWDNMKVDGDQISMMMNGKWVLHKHTLSQHKFKLDLKIDPHSNNFLVLYAHNLGTQPPNTAAIRFYDGERTRELLLKSDLGECGAINFVYQSNAGLTGYQSSK